MPGRDLNTGTPAYEVEVLLVLSVYVVSTTLPLHSLEKLHKPVTIDKGQ
jgi:hypothetical protein